MPTFTRSLDFASPDRPSDLEQYLPHPLDHSNFHNEVINNSYQHKESVIDVLLRIQAHNHQRANHCETISYPHWTNERMAPIWIVNPWIDSIREEYPSDQVKLPTRSLLHLHDSDLATNSLGFEHHAALGIILEGGWREPGFHIFPFKTHLYTIMGEHPFPIPITKMYIVLPEYLVTALPMLVFCLQSTLFPVLWPTLSGLANLLQLASKHLFLLHCASFSHHL